MLDVHNLVAQYINRLELDLSITVNAVEVDHEGGKAFITATLTDGHVITTSGPWSDPWAPSIRAAITSSTIDSLYAAREAVLSGITSMANEDRPQ